MGGVFVKNTSLETKCFANAPPKHDISVYKWFSPATPGFLCQNIVESGVHDNPIQI